MKFTALLCRVTNLTIEKLRPDTGSWRLSAIEEFKIALFLETVTGEHYPSALLDHGIRSVADCFDAYRVKLSHQDSRVTFGADEWVSICGRGDPELLCD